MKRYPFLDLNDVTAPMRDEIVEAATRVIDSGRYIGGEECAEFEKELSRIAAPYCVGVSNGLDALRLIFRSFIELGRLKPGDEVIVPANTYIASILAVTDNGLKPVFVEPDPDTMNLSDAGIEAAITPQTKAVLIVHLYGRAAGSRRLAETLRNRGILLVEDNAQAIGARTADGVYTGALGDAAAFSFYPTKNVGAIGDAGTVSTLWPEVADMVRTLANYGSDRRYHNIVEGYNCRLDPIQAAILRVKLKHIEEENTRRRELADIYCYNIHNNHILIPENVGTQHAWHQYVVRTDRREELIRHLDENGVGWDIHYATPPHRQPCFERYATLDLPVTERIADTVLSLPIGPTTTPSDAHAIARIISAFTPES